MKRIPYISAAELFPERVDTRGNVVLDLLTTFLHFHEASLHRHPTRLSNDQTSLSLRSTRADVLIFSFSHFLIFEICTMKGVIHTFL